MHTLHVSARVGVTRPQEQEECIRETRVLSSLDSDYIIKYYDSFLERVGACGLGTCTHGDCVRGARGAAEVLGGTGERTYGVWIVHGKQGGRVSMVPWLFLCPACSWSWPGPVVGDAV